MAVSANDIEKGLDACENLIGNPFIQMAGIRVERDMFEELDAVIVSPPPATMFEDYLDESQIEQLATAPDMIIVGSGGYIFIGDEFSVKAALAAMRDTGTGTNRMASMEIEWNIDGFLTQFNPENAGPWVELIESEEFQDLLLRFYNATQDLEELGTSRYSALIQDGEHIEIDVLTSRESLKFFEAVNQVIEETPDETWGALGQMVGEILSEQSGMGPSTGMGDMEGGTPEEETGPGGDEHPGKPDSGNQPSGKPDEETDGEGQVGV
jgi:hypothetical protein